MPQETYRTIIEQISRTKSSAVTVFADFCRISACALAAQTREEEYFEAIKPYSKDELELITKAFALLIEEAEASPFVDVLGEYYLEIAAHSSKQARGEFYTPPPICELMAKISVDADSTIEKGVPFTISEPACGAGMMVLAIAKQFSPILRDGEESHVDLLRVTCQDINPVATDMSFINTTLWGIPAKVILGNYLSSEAPQKTWKNIHWHRVGEDQRQQLLEVRDIFMGWKPMPNENASNFTPRSTKPEKFEQPEFDLDLGMASGRTR